MILMSQESITIRMKAYEIEALIRSNIKPMNLDALLNLIIKRFNMHNESKNELKGHEFEKPFAIMR
jgi:hypothetical protein